MFLPDIKEKKKSSNRVQVGYSCFLIEHLQGSLVLAFFVLFCILFTLQELQEKLEQTAHEGWPQRRTEKTKEKTLGICTENYISSVIKVHKFKTPCPQSLKEKPSPPAVLTGNHLRYQHQSCGQKKKCIILVRCLVLNLQLHCM